MSATFGLALEGNPRRFSVLGEWVSVPRSSRCEREGIFIHSSHIFVVGEEFDGGLQVPSASDVEATVEMLRANARSVTQELAVAPTNWTGGVDVHLGMGKGCQRDEEKTEEHSVGRHGDGWG